MLSELAIKNFAIIDDLRISFSEGLTILSGETGAGKSIIINAVNLLLGSRASAKLIRTGEKSAEVEAVFIIQKDGDTADKLRAQGYEAGEELIVKRIISATNRHKIYINGSAATIQVLTDVTTNLASISGQHAHQQLLKEDNHLLTLDAFAGLTPLRQTVAETYNNLLPRLRELDSLKKRRQKQAEQIELLAFQKNEIETARISPGEDENLENEKKRLKNAQELYTLIFECIEGLYDAQGSVVEQLARVKKNLDTARAIDETLASHQETAADLMVRAEDAAGALRDYLETIQTDGIGLEDVEERLDLLTRLKRKYGQTLSDVLARLDEIDAELAGLGNLDDRIAATEAAIADTHAALAGACKELSEKRLETAGAFDEKIETELAMLKMADTRFRVQLTHLPAAADTYPFLCVDGKTVGETGIDKAEFQIAPNVGEDMKPLAGIASGGELSRVVLALKAVLADKESVETVIFDEVDAGIGGETAEVVGKKLAALAGFHQIICITHLPQIAKFGQHHCKIEKDVANGRTTTTITQLEENDRIREIARMTGGEEITEKTLAHAEEMLEQAGTLL
ncbi:MAG: DNA repair protein RecN [Thermodesulfobacteriota bacterium]|nr:DNA repair protein RecN [Thermodesulfobacteriota bacterium]